MLVDDAVVHLEDAAVGRGATRTRFQHFCDEREAVALAFMHRDNPTTTNVTSVSQTDSESCDSDDGGARERALRDGVEVRHGEADSNGECGGRLWGR